MKVALFTSRKEAEANATPSFLDVEFFKSLWFGN